MIWTIFLIILILLLMVSLPVWSYSLRWGYAGTGLVGFMLVVLILVLIF